MLRFSAALGRVGLPSKGFRAVPARADVADLAGQRASLDFPFILMNFFVSRATLELVGILTTIILRPDMRFAPAKAFASAPWLAIWGASDTGWYTDLALHGYQTSPLTSGPGAGQANWAFFPAYPMLSAGIANVAHVPVFLVMLALSNLCFIAALVLAAREALCRFDRETARFVVILFCFLPGSYIFSAAYTESLFLLLVILTFAAIRERRWLTAGVVAALAALTRNLGLVLILPMGIGFLADQVRNYRTSQTFSRPELARVSFAAALPCAALAGFCAFLYFRAGDPFAFVTIQKAWGHRFQIPFSGAIAPILGVGTIDPDQALNWLAAAASVAALWGLLRARQFSLASFGLVSLFAPLAAGPTSLLRYCIGNAPVVLAAAQACARNPDLAAALIASGAVINGFLMACWVLGLPITH